MPAQQSYRCLKLTRAAFLDLPVGGYLVSGVRTGYQAEGYPGGVRPCFAEVVARTEERAAQWGRIKKAGANQRNCFLYSSKTDWEQSHAESMSLPMPIVRCEAKITKADKTGELRLMVCGARAIRFSFHGGCLCRKHVGEHDAWATACGQPLAVELPAHLVSRAAGSPLTEGK